MFKKIRTFFRIRKLYKMLDETNFITKLSDMTADNLNDVLFDINEALKANSYTFCSEAYDLDIWLSNLYHDIEAIRHKKPTNLKPIILAVLAVYCVACLVDLFAPIGTDRGSWWNILFHIANFIC